MCHFPASFEVIVTGNVICAVLFTELRLLCIQFMRVPFSFAKRSSKNQTLENIFSYDIFYYTNNS